MSPDKKGKKSNPVGQKNYFSFDKKKNKNPPKCPNTSKSNANLKSNSNSFTILLKHEELNGMFYILPIFRLLRLNEGQV